MQESTEEKEKKSNELIQECFSAMADAPLWIVKAFKRSFSALETILTEHPETIQKTLPFLLKVLDTLFDGKWYEALGYLSLLIAFVGCEYAIQEGNK